MAASKLGKFGNDYLRLGLRIGKHQNGYVDYYYGPPDIEERVDKESKILPQQLLEDCSSLQKKVFDQSFDAKREIYLEKMLDAMGLYIKKEFLKEKVPIEEDLRIQCDMDIQPFKESELDDLRDQFDEAYKGNGTLEERMKALRVKRMLPKRKAWKAFKKGIKIVAKRTQEVFPDMLPKGEKIKLNKTLKSDGINWVSYDWYQGNFASIVDVTLDYGMYWTGILRVCAHESYPGHHTQFAVAEDKLYNELNHFERAILLYCNPYMIICEGIANLSLNSLFTAREQEEIALTKFCPDPANGPSVDLLMKQTCVRKKLPMIDYNAAYHAHVDGWDKEAVRNYIKDFEIWDSTSLDNKIALIFSPIFKMSGYAYQIGKQLIIDKFGEYPSPKDFRYLIENPVLPSDLV